MDLTRSEAELLTGIAAGDVNAFETLHARYERKVRSLCQRLLRDHTEAEEVAQEAFLQVWRRAGQFDVSRGRPVSWLLAITYHLVIDHVRRRRYDAIPASAFVELRAVTMLEDPGDLAVDAVVALEMRGAIERLTAEQRRTIWLAYYAGYSHREIAENLGVPFGTVKSRIRLGLHKLRRLLGGGFF